MNRVEYGRNSSKISKLKSLSNVASRVSTVCDSAMLCLRIGVGNKQVIQTNE